MPNYNNDDCIDRNENPYDIRTFNKVEVINALNEYPLRELLSERNIMVDNNVIINRYLYCIWKQRSFINSKNAINYPLLEQIIAEAVSKVVDVTGPGIYLSKAYARTILVDTQTIVDDNIGTKIARIQNHLVINLQNLIKRL